MPDIAITGPGMAKEALELQSFGSKINAAVIGASGGIGSAIADDLDQCKAACKVLRLSRSMPKPLNPVSAAIMLDLEDEATIAHAAAHVAKTAGKLHLVIVATGLLHEREGMRPEKTWRSLSAAAMDKAFRINTIGPALVAKHFLPLLARDQKTVFAALSARVGSIEDNHLGGWYAYRASKAALNMMIKTLSIELARVNPHAICVGLHPGTVDTSLSKPFQAGVPQDRLFSPAHSARQLLTVIDQLAAVDTGRVYAWDGKVVPS